MDLSMPDMDGVQATRELLRTRPNTPVLILSMHTDENYVRNAREAGAKGYLMKNAVDVDLASAIRTLATGGESFAGLPEGSDESDRYDRLTPREKQVFLLIAQGKSNKEIAEVLGLSANTVSVHRNNLMSTLDIHRTAELILYAVRRGLITPP
jgi:DNA-binding NarL/FixJ family response regulator